MFQVPSSVVVRRPISLNGAIVPVGTPLSKAQVEALGRNLNALLDSGVVVATPDPFARKGKARPTPSSLPPVIRNAMVAKLTTAQPLSVIARVAGDAVSVEIVGGVPTFTVSLDDGNAEAKPSRTTAFSNVSDGDHVISVTDGSGNTSEARVEVAHVEPKKPRKKAEERE